MVVHFGIPVGCCSDVVRLRFFCLQYRCCFSLLIRKSLISRLTSVLNRKLSAQKFELNSLAGRLRLSLQFAVVFWNYMSRDAFLIEVMPNMLCKRSFVWWNMWWHKICAAKCTWGWSEKMCLLRWLDKLHNRSVLQLYCQTFGVLFVCSQLLYIVNFCTRRYKFSFPIAKGLYPL